MTDGLYFNDESLRGPGSTCPETQLQINTEQPQIDLSTFALWIELQPVEVSIDLLYRIAADLAANKGWPGVSYEVRRAADDLRTLTRHRER